MFFTKKEKRIIILTEKFNRKDKAKIWYLLIILDRDVTKAVGMKNMSKNPAICL